MGQGSSRVWSGAADSSEQARQRLTPSPPWRQQTRPQMRCWERVAAPTTAAAPAAPAARRICRGHRVAADG